MRDLRPIAVTLALASIALAQEPVRPRVGLVLSGGGARGAAHIGVIQVLEQLQIPVDYVVGTSMGSIVGGLYATGYAPEEIRAIVEEADWATIFADAPPRDELWFRRRQDNRRFLVDLEFGWRDGGPALPPGLILGRNVTAFLERLTLEVSTIDDFDDLRIPFRCVATDIADGSALVFERGKLATAIRASMSLPGVFAPVVHDGRFLVDGGVVDNVPVDVARDLGSDVLIVVDISTPLGDPRELRSLLSVSDQVVGILMAENRRRSMDSLTDEDVGIVPELGDLGAMDFPRCAEAIDIGYATALAVSDRLSELSVDDTAWSAWVDRHRRPEPTVRSVRNLTIDARTTLSEDVIREFTALEAGGRLDAEVMRDTRERLAGLGLFERIEIDIEPVSESTDDVDIVLRPIEKDWGPHYFRFGLGASSDLLGSGEFALGVQHTWTPVNSLGGEWRNEVQIGTDTRLFTEFYQPLDSGLEWFVAPSIEFEQRNLPLIFNRQKVAEFNAEATAFVFDLGRNLGSWGELRVGYGWLTGELRPEIALPGLFPPRVDIETAELRSQLLIDTLDDSKFPHGGVLGAIEWNFSDESMGSSARNSRLSASLGAPLSFDALTVFPNFEGGTMLEDGTPIGGEFFLGGFQRISGLQQRELSGDHYVLGVLQSYYQLSNRTTRFDTATYFGASLEVGGIWASNDPVRWRDLLVGGSVFLAADSFVGPAYVAFGVAEGGDRAAYVFIGPTF